MHNLRSGSLDVVELEAFHLLYILETRTSASDLHARCTHHISHLSVVIVIIKIKTISKALSFLVISCEGDECII